MNKLGDLIDPAHLHGDICIKGFDEKTLKDFIHLMIIIRKTEQKLAEGRRDVLIGGPVHLGVGQEAIAVGVSHKLRATDRVFGAHRSHSHLLALNPNFYKLFAEVLGKETGFSKGMGGSMHLFDQSHGFYGSVPIVAGTVSLAVGAGLAAKMQSPNGQDFDIGVAYIGDGAVEEGVVHESFNLASTLNIPILFVIENNLFASHMHISQRQPSNDISRFATANNIQSAIVDGNDVVSMAKVADQFISNARAGGGPALIEAVTYRWYGHVDWREDIDVGIERSLVDVENWKSRDPVLRLSRAMINEGIWSHDEQRDFQSALDSDITANWNKAMNDEYPSAEATLKYVYK
ncbi:MAG: thiamine pyrophosphate-dependent dehydrogenase E1 component subunit alpha [Paracoccaceae bacterium]